MVGSLEILALSPGLTHDFPTSSSSTRLRLQKYTIFHSIHSCPTVSSCSLCFLMKVEEATTEIFIGIKECSSSNSTNKMREAQGHINQHRVALPRGILPPVFWHCSVAALLVGFSASEPHTHLARPSQNSDSAGSNQMPPGVSQISSIL